LFDAGDAQSAGTMKVMPPADSNVTSFSGCTYTPPPGNSTGPPWGSTSATNSDCSISNVQSSTGWNGQWVTWTVPIPSTYTCNATDPNGCWIKMRVNFPSGNVTDTTTWKAALDSDPVRLIH
jgi:hypothetical protein